MDQDEELELTRWAVALVERDIHATVRDRPTFGVKITDGDEGEGVVIGYRHGPSWGTIGVELGPTRASSLAEVAATLQIDVSDQRRIWPVCPEHDRGLHATVDGESAVWFCQAGPHVVARIGHLGEVLS